MDRRPPWQEWLTPAQYAELFPRGQADLDDFYNEVEDEERYGIPSICQDAEVYADVARIAAGRPAAA